MRLSAGSFAGDAVTVSQLVEGLAPFAGRIVVNRTDLAGYFDLDLEWTPDAAGGARLDGADGVVDRDARSLFTALREQLGVKVENARGPVDVVVIDSIDTLTPN